MIRTEVSVLQTAAAVLGQKLLDAGFRMNPHVADELSALRDLVIGVEITDIDWCLFFLPQDGYIQITEVAPHEPDTWIRSSAINLIKARQANPGDGVHLEVSGDVSAGQNFQHILRSLEFDWEEMLAAHVGDIAAYRIGKGVRAINWWLRRSADSAAFSTGEYLREEVRLAADRNQIQQFVVAVDELRDDIERLAARLQRLE